MSEYLEIAELKRLYQYFTFTPYSAPTYSVLGQNGSSVDMANQTLDKQKQAIAKNLIETCGLQRAFHAARQFGWHDIAEEINDRIGQESSDTAHEPVRH
jgi:hypothetical protein